VPESPEDLLRLDSPAVLVWASRADGARTYFNESWLAFRGRRLEDELGDGWSDGMHRGDLARCLAVYTRAIDRHEPFRMAYRLRAADGSWRWISDQGSARFTSHGEFAGMLGVCIELRAGAPPTEPLTRAELRVLALLTTHLSPTEIARRCFLSHNTIRSHIRAVYRKLGVHSRAEALSRAEEIGIVAACGADGRGALSPLDDARMPNFDEGLALLLEADATVTHGAGFSATNGGGKRGG
jgi:PAS domain S-box-containing protein